MSHGAEEVIDLCNSPVAPLRRGGLSVGGSGGQALARPSKPVRSLGIGHGVRSSDGIGRKGGHSSRCSSFCFTLFIGGDPSSPSDSSRTDPSRDDDGDGEHSCGSDSEIVEPGRENASEGRPEDGDAPSEAKQREPATEAWLREACKVGGDARYYVFQKEAAPGTGRLHWQGFVQLCKQRALSSIVKAFLPQHPHIEVCKGSAAQNIAYCSKSASRVDGPFEWGCKPAQGKRKDLDHVREMISAGKRMKEIVMEATSYQGMRGAEMILKYADKPYCGVREVWWFHGKTGTGKTKKAYDICGEDCWISMGSLQWFEGYDGEDAAIFDDLRRSSVSFSHLLRYLDRYPVRVPVKGASRPWMAKKIVITSPWAPDVLFTPEFNGGDSVDQLLRRITHIELCGDEPCDPPVDHSKPRSV